MKSVVSYSQAAAQGGDKLTLYDEALKDLVRFFADAGEMNEAYDYFSRLGKKRAHLQDAEASGPHVL